jgi:hypothetical protein
MQLLTILSLVATASAASLMARLGACPTASGSPCGIVSALGTSVTYPKCTCKPTCEGDVSFSGITAHVVSIPKPSERIQKKHDANSVQQIGVSIETTSSLTECMLTKFCVQSGRPA